jgi:prepilin-type N-terminal cleavage/methylation domain-containing protein
LISNVIQKQKKRNSGFSLIELIIAIAVLVILLGLLAPQFMHYLDKARQARAMQNADNIMQTIQGLSIDELVANKTVDSRGNALADLHYEAVTNVEGVTVPDDTATYAKDRIREIYNAVNASPPGYEYAFICCVEYNEIVLARFKDLQTLKVYTWEPDSGWSVYNNTSGTKKYWYQDVMTRTKMGSAKVYWNGQPPTNSALQKQFNKINGTPY